jgi:hypothetical protein
VDRPGEQSVVRIAFTGPRRSGTAACIIGIALLAASFAGADSTQVAPPASPPLLYASWGAPWGTPRASAHVMAPCGTVAAYDTLYLTFDPGRDAPAFFGIMGEVYFRANSPDTLGSLWSFDDRPETDNNFQVEFPTPNDSSWGAPSPWKGQGFGAKKYDRTPGSGRLQIVYAVAEQVAGPVKAGRRYAWARLILPRGVKSMGRCEQPVCVEWSTAGLTFVLDSGEVDAARQGGSRFTTWNSKDGRSCADYTGIIAPSGWKPKRSSGR